MSTTSTHTTTVTRRIGLGLLTGAAGALITLATAGTAAATPDPILPGQPITPVQSANPVAPVRGAQVALNPQPLPPGPDATSPIMSRNLNRGAQVALNPQPLPPGPEESNEMDEVHVQQLGSEQAQEEHLAQSIIAKQNQDFCAACLNNIR